MEGGAGRRRRERPCSNIPKKPLGMVSVSVINRPILYDADGNRLEA
jgi:hypothetical protein